MTSILSESWEEIISLLMPLTRTFWVDIGYACYGIIAENGRVIDAAPIASWMIGRTLKEIRPFLVRKRAIVQELD